MAERENGAERPDATAGGEAFRSQLDRFGQLVFSPVGGSMYPMLFGSRDVVVLRRGPLRRLDVAMYRNELGEYVLHRALRVAPEGVVFCGDSRLTPDPPVPPERVLAVMTEFYRKDRLIRARNPLYRAYARLWCASLGLRRILLRLCYRLQAIRTRLRKEKKHA